MVDLLSIVRMFCFYWSFIGYYGAYLFKKYSIKRFFVFGPLWSNRSRFRLCCTSSCYIWVDVYLNEFLQYIFTVQTLETKTIRKTILKTILLLAFKIVESLSCKKQLNISNNKNQILAALALVLFLTYTNINKNNY